MHHRPPLVLAAALLWSALPFIADPARACGGLFCSSVSPTPVDQSAERILFEVNDDGSVTATVEIKYQGDPRAFSWIVPVSGTPDFVEVAAKDELQLLDAATRINVVPPSTTCSNPPFDPSFGCSDRLMVLESAAPVPGSSGVSVQQYPSVGPFDDIVVVEGTDPVVLMAWLGDHGYQVTEAMRPFIEQYTVEGYKFLATRLEATADVRDMVPIRFHCPRPFPEIPLRLTAIAAEPDMGFIVFVAGAQRYTPSNYAEVELAEADIQVSRTGASNYFALVSKRIDEAGGLGFVVERAQPSASLRQLVDNTFLGTETEAEARTNVEAVLARRGFVTRFYGRMSADEMIEDPQFIPSDAGEFAGTFDLSDRTVEVCPATGAPNLAPPPCGTLYCGDGDACAQSEDLVDGCVCRNNHTARATTSPTGGLQVMCTSPDIDVHGSGANPCTGFTCGEGTCLPVNDRPTCRCSEGAVAVIEGTQVLCVPSRGQVFENDQILWPALPSIDDAAAGCTAATGNRVGGALSLALLFASAGAARRLLQGRQGRKQRS